MTDYNERLDEALALIKYSVEYGETHGGCPPKVSAIKRHGVAEAKQALTSLIKELVAEAKPKIDLLDIGVLTGGTIAIDKLGRKNIHAPVDEQKFTDSRTIEVHQAAYMVAYKLSSDIFEQNLLKALEEV